MRSFTLNLAASILAFICGIVTVVTWNHGTIEEIPERIVVENCPPATPPPPSSYPDVTQPKPFREIGIGATGLRLVSDEVRLRSEQLRYDVNLRYPQVLGSDDAHIRRLNQRIKEIATAKYQWMLTPSGALRDYDDRWTGVFNSFSMDYEVSLATDSLLSISFYGYSYAIGNPQATQENFTVNYDLLQQKELKLSDIFKRDSNYLEFLSRYCRTDVSQKYDSRYTIAGAFTPDPKNFENWRITRKGITFNFDGCKIAGCAAGDLDVEIPFYTLRDMLSPHNSLKSALSQYP